MRPAATRLSRLVSLISRWNRAHNLYSRRLSEPELTDLLHDALAFSPFIPMGASIIDLGSGAGIPGLPLAIFRPDLHITLLEPRAKRCTWLRYASQTLKLNTEVIEGRWDSSYDRWDRVISRAVFPPERFLTEVGVLAPLCLQRTSVEARPADDERRRVHITQQGRPRGVVLCGVSIPELEK